MLNNPNNLIDLLQTMKIRIGNYIADLEYGFHGEVTGVVNFDENILITAVANNIEDVKNELIKLIASFEKHQKPHRSSELSGGYSNSEQLIIWMKKEGYLLFM